MGEDDDDVDKSERGDVVAAKAVRHFPAGSRCPAPPARRPASLLTARPRYSKRFRSFTYGALLSLTPSCHSPLFPLGKLPRPRVHPS